MSDLQVASTILQQLGGKHFIAMTGANNFVGFDSGLMFMVPKHLCRNGANKVRIVLDPSDTYTVEFWHIRGMDWRQISKHDLIYADRLQQLFAEQTGMAVRL